MSGPYHGPSLNRGVLQDFLRTSVAVTARIIKVSFKLISLFLLILIRTLLAEAKGILAGVPGLARMGRLLRQIKGRSGLISSQRFSLKFNFI